jgi:invasion protein IalB
LHIAASLAFAALIAAQNSIPVAAQDVAAWRVECTSDGKTLDCRAVQQLFQRDSRQLVLAILVRKAPDPKAAAVMIQLLLGLSLTDPVVKVDNCQPERQPIQTCTNVGCFVTFTQTTSSPRCAGTELKITVQDSNKKAIDLSVPLLGFALAFDKARS